MYEVKSKKRMLSPQPENKLPQLHAKGAELFGQHAKRDHQITKYIIGRRCKKLTRLVQNKELSDEGDHGLQNSPIQNDFMYSP